MNFQLTDEQNLIREMVRSFAETEVAPSAQSRDEEERFDRALMFDRLAELAEPVAELGLEVLHLLGVLGHGQPLSV